MKNCKWIKRNKKGSKTKIHSYTMGSGKNLI